MLFVGFIFVIYLTDCQSECTDSNKISFVSLKHLDAEYKLSTCEGTGNLASYAPGYLNRCILEEIDNTHRQCESVCMETENCLGYITNTDNACIHCMDGFNGEQDIIGDVASQYIGLRMDKFDAHIRGIVCVFYYNSNDKYNQSINKYRLSLNSRESNCSHTTFSYN